MFSMIDHISRRIISTVIRTAAPKKGIKRRWQPCLEMLEDRCVPATVSTLSSSFNGTSISSGNTLWFNSVLNVAGVGTNLANVYITNQTITFSDTKNGVTTPYTLTVPNADIVLSATTTTATTTFSSSLNEWVTTSSSAISQAGNLFMSGLSWPVPSGGLGGGDNPVTWSAQFSTDTPGVTLNWAWSAVAYNSFTTTYNSLGVKPCGSSTASSYNNGDYAGSPENYKSHLTGGARYSNSTNYVGSYGPIGSLTPTALNTFISGVVFNDINANGTQQSSDPAVWLDRPIVHQDKRHPLLVTVGDDHQRRPGGLQLLDAGIAGERHVLRRGRGAAGGLFANDPVVVYFQFDPSAEWAVRLRLSGQRRQRCLEHGFHEHLHQRYGKPDAEQHQQQRARHR